MDTPEQIPPTWPCRRCEHSYAAHDDRGACTVEFSPGAVPSTQLGNTCSCAAYVYEPATPDPEPGPTLPEVLDGPAMYERGRVLLQRAVTTASYSAQREAFINAATFFAGAQAAALAEIAIDNGTGDLAERRWSAALAGEALPEFAPQEVAQA
jgi:hypothetical protein